MTAAGRRGIPCTFLVDRAGKLAWVGDLSRIGRPLNAVLHGRFDAGKQAQAKELRERVRIAARHGRYDEALAALDGAIPLDEASEPMYRATKLLLLLRTEDYEAANDTARHLTRKA